MEDQVRGFVTYARQLTANSNFSKALEVYFLAFEKNPQVKNIYETEVQTVLLKLSQMLSAAGKIEELFTNFSRALKAFPDNIYIINDTGKYLYKYGYYGEAWCHFQRALKINPGYVNAEKNLNSIKNLLVERWHFRMLNDKIRNETYRTAIHESITPIKDSVVDIGTGTGLLSLFAYECKPMVITACDESEVMIEMAEYISQDMGINDIILVNKMSTTMTHIDIGGKRSLLITEMFDAGLFGEHILKVVEHAWEHLLNSAGRVLPCRAEFFVCAASCKELNLLYHLGDAAKSLLNIPELNIHVLLYNEPYDCEDVNSFKDLKYLTKPESLIKVNFNSYNDIKEKLQCTEPFSVNLNATEDGEMHVILGWFNLQLTENASLTTDPRSPQRCNAWQQAVFFDLVPKTVKKDDTIKLDFLINSNKLTVLPNCKSAVDRISTVTMRFLNDSELMKMITGCIGMACVYLGQIVEMCEINMVDLCPFPVFGLLMLKRGAKSLLCYAQTVSDEEFIKKVMSANNIDLSKVTVLVGDLWSQDTFKDDKFHAIFSNILELVGEINIRLKDIAQNLRESHLFQGGLFMPSKIQIMGQVVDCHWLDINNRVDDENTHNFKISEYINRYQVSQNCCLDISHLEYNPLTEPVSIGTYNSNFRSEVINVPVINNGDANAILCWYTIEIMEDLGEISTNRPNSFIDNTAFLADPKVAMATGNVANILRCVDSDGAFKLMIDVETPSGT